MSKLTEEEVARLFIAAEHWGIRSSSDFLALGKRIKKGEKKTVVVSSEIKALRSKLPHAVAERARSAGLTKGTQFVDINWVTLMARPEARGLMLSCDGPNAERARDWMLSELSAIDRKYHNVRNSKG
jgi:hypothetical protein